MGSPCPTLLMDRGILMENRIIGLPRLRQLKVHNSSCHIVSQFSGIIRKCFARYDPDKVKIYLGLFFRLISLITQEDRETFAPERQRYSSLDAWTYKTAEELGSLIIHKCPYMWWVYKHVRSPCGGREHRTHATFTSVWRRARRFGFNSESQ